MSDRVISETTVGVHEVSGRTVRVLRSEWRDHRGHSFGLDDVNSGEYLTPDECFDEYPTQSQMEAVVEEFEDRKGASRADGEVIRATDQRDGTDGQSECDECRELIPDTGVGDSLSNRHHRPSCSLYDSSKD